MAILVTGATGYIGGRLVSRLVEIGLPVRLLVRNRHRISGRWWAGDVEIVEGDLHDPEALAHALDGAREAYYLVHSMTAGADYAARDRAAAEAFVSAAPLGLRHCVYLGGLQPPGADSSEHLASRAEVGAILRRGVPTTEFRAGPIVGSGSASFEMVRYLVERVPVMLTPKWIVNEVQPIAVRDVLTYLVAAREREPLGIVEIGGADRLSFRDMLRQYAEVRGLARVIRPVPGLSPRFAARCIAKVTPVPSALVEPLLQGIVHPVLADTTRAAEAFPAIRPMTYRTAVERALARMSEHAVETRWSDALGGAESFELRDREGVLEETRTVYVPRPPEQVFRAFCRVGGEQGWLAYNWMWRARGWIDSLVGGPGLRRGRRDPETLLPGDAVDFWRVELVEPARLLRLRAEMKVPGKAWLQFTAMPEGEGTRFIQTALYAPRGLLGLLYWWAMIPAHAFIFTDMARAIARLAMGEGAPPASTPPVRA
ncbi:MAG: SDR family oxidoreductase [Gemmatimonadaceae bacterium]|jgi:uncharacterized protein YbjT (DUF2867 family)/uncharacterized protein YndB with AHSA1/START domain|nr:SDR family oxidoreductase [Gemmatimonadaceae bacterium]